MAFSEWVTSKTWAAEDVSVAEANEQWRDRPQSLKDALDAEPKTNSDGVSHAQGTVVRLTATAGQVARSTSAGQTGPMGVQVSSTAVAASGTGYYRFGGMVYVLCTGPVAVGDTLQTSSTAGTAIVGSTNPFARAHGVQASGTGLVLAEIENDVATSGSLPSHDHQDASTGGVLTSARLETDVRNAAGTVRAQFVGTNELSLAIGSAALAASATEGFFYLSSSAGPPTGTPTAATGRVPLHYDTTNNRLYAYNGAWVYLPMGPVDSVRVYLTANQSFSDSTLTDCDFDGEDHDTNSLHFTSNAALTGTVAKTNGGNTLTGTGTSFTTELSVGQVISVPGGATEERTVTEIASNTSLTVESNWAQTASGQTATRVRTAIVARTAGLYVIMGVLAFVANATNVRLARILVNDVQKMQNAVVGSAATDAFVPVLTVLSLAQWSRVKLNGRQTSGGALNAYANETWLAMYRYSPPS